jgi:hypothetical protein
MLTNLEIRRRLDRFNLVELWGHGAHTDGAETILANPSGDGRGHRDAASGWHRNPPDLPERRHTLSRPVEAGPHLSIGER